MKKAQKLQEMEKKLALNMDIIKCFTLVWTSKLSVIFSLAKKEESAERYREAFYICKVMGYEDDLQIIRNEAKKYLDIIF